MELSKVKELIEMMKANDLNELEIVDGTTRIMLKRGPDHTVTAAIPAPVVAPATLSAPPATATAGESAPADQGDQHDIVSPIVGTFYAAPSPTSDPFVTVGDHVDENTVVCIVEAMKVMNEIKAGVRGTIKKVLVENGAAVEFNQPLFLVEVD